MVTFFRKIRFHLMEQHKTGKYIKYAVGEIALVVIGILIALQINNWNEGRKEQRSEQNYLRRLLVDLENDYNTLTFSKGLSKDRIQQIKLLTDVIQTPALSKEYTINIIESIEKVTWRSYLPLSKIVYNELMHSGKMSLIQSENLRNELSNYYADADHWEMILNTEDAQKEFSHATAGLLSVDILTAIENSSSLRNTSPVYAMDMTVKQEDFDRIVADFSSNEDAIKWLPQLNHYHILADKVITNLTAKNKSIQQIVIRQLH